MSFGYLVDKNKQILFNLVKPFTLEEVQQRRLSMEYYNIIMDGKVAINI